MFKKFKENLGIKVIALLLAIFLWYYVKYVAK